MIEPSLIAINVGNTRAQLGLFIEGELSASERFSNADPSQAVQWAVDQWEKIAQKPQPVLVMSSVNDTAADRLAAMIEDQLSVEVYRIGADLPAPIGQDLDPETITGADRLLNAAAAFEKVKQACIVIDAGTAVTVDFVDGEGTFHGGAIAPGARMQLKALHEHTALLPEVEFRAPDGDAFGRSTTQAMLNGVYYGISGMVRRLAERYAEQYGAYPKIIATGGDAAVLFENDDLIDVLVPELTLHGIAAAMKYALAARAQNSED